MRADVVALEPLGDALSDSVPIIRFTTMRGDQVVVAMPGADLSPGDSVNVLYDANRPETVRLNDDWGLWFEAWALALAGALLVVIPAAAWLRERFRSSS